jgi:aromatic ring-opening dioxygenase catalytic subunit (LigB family)
MNLKKQIIYISHGGGPLPILGDPGHAAMVTFLKALPEKLIKPAAIVVISAHWEEPQATILNNPQSELFYDYYGFPAESYQLNYPVPGNPELANELLLKLKGLEAKVETSRGLDHGVFIPLMLMYPKADIPVVQISLISGLNPLEHLALGAALKFLLEKDVLIIGSGFSFHNLNAFFNSPSGTKDLLNDAFQDWLLATCCEGSWEERKQNLANWELAPNARYCHPRAEHLLPLHVCAAINESKAEVIFDDLIFGKRGVAFAW